MNMSKERKNMQVKLRRKYKWSTNTDYRRGAVLEKYNASSSKSHSTDIYFNVLGCQTRESLLGNKNAREINLALLRYKNDEKGTFENSLGVMLTFEELELMYNIAKAYREEVKKEYSKEETK